MNVLWKNGHPCLRVRSKYARMGKRKNEKQQPITSKTVKNGALQDCQSDVWMWMRVQQNYKYNARISFQHKQGPLTQSKLIILS